MAPDTIGNLYCLDPKFQPRQFTLIHAETFSQLFDVKPFGLLSLLCLLSDLVLQLE